MHLRTRVVALIGLFLVSACAQRSADDFAVKVPSTSVVVAKPQPQPAPEPRPTYSETPMAPLANVSAAGRKCLAQAIYFEARNESLLGQMAVAAVVLNRVRSEDFPDTICGVVRQGGEDPSAGCQFSWWCDGKSDVPREAAAWADALRLAGEMIAGLHPDRTDGALYFHNRSVTPDWRDRLHQTAEIDQHYYYR